MKLFKPTWVNHEGNLPIFSIDIHPDGSRFATGGQGDNCGRVTIWNMAPLLNRDDEHNENVPKQLCRLDNHQSCVNCVRWSNSGRYLASAGDDKIIMIWQFAGQGGVAFGGVTNAESWRCCNSLRGHSGDILDLNWSPNDSYLATCSVDNTIRVWNAENFPECLKIISGHSGFVKGVSWDPMGKYLSSQSDDKSLKIWRTSDWKEEVSINEPFLECGGTTHVLRLNWCPDGQFLVSAHAMNNLGSTAQIITREEWKTDKDFVGHRKAVTCLRFSPKTFYKKDKKDRKNKYFCVAIGSRDRSLSVWLINRTRPLFVMHDLFSDTILDLSWSQDGYKLLICSSDGTVAFFEFTETDLGKALDGEEVRKDLHKLYGKNMISMNSKKSNSTMFIEDVEMLRAKEANEANNKAAKGHQPITQNGLPSRSSNPLSENTNSNTSRLSKGSTDRQIETRTSDGKRRITPLYIPPTLNHDGLPVPFNHTESQITFSTKKVMSSIQIEKVDSMQSASLLSQPSPDKRTESNDQSKELQRRETPNQTSQTNNSNSSGVNNKQPASVNNKIESGNDLTKKSQQQASKFSSKEKGQSGQSSKSANSSTGSVGDKSKANSTNPSHPKRVDLTTIMAAPVKQLSAAPPPVALNEKRPPEKQTKESSFKSNFVNLFAPKVERILSINLSSTSERFKDRSLVVDNNLSGSVLCSLKMLDQELNTVWQVLVSQRISAVVNSDEIACACCEDNTVHVFNLQTGSRLSTPFLLSSPVSKLSCFKHKVLAITVKAELCLWDLNARKMIVKNVSLLPLIYNNSSQTDISLINYCITSNGLPLITLSTGKTYVYDLGMENWQLLSDNQDLLNYSCDYKQKLGADVKEHPLSLIQSQQRYLRQIHNVFVANRNLQPKATLSYIDQQLSSSLQLSSSKEYRYWLTVLARFLTNEGLEERFRELCEFLLGPVFASSTTDWQSSVLGVDKRELLKEVLSISTGNIKLQRIYKEFKEQLDQVEQIDQMQIDC